MKPARNAENQLFQTRRELGIQHSDTFKNNQLAPNQSIRRLSRHITHRVECTSCFTWPTHAYVSLCSKITFLFQQSKYKNQPLNKHYQEGRKNNKQKWTKHTAHEEEMTYGHKILVNKKPNLRSSLGEPSAGRRITLQWMNEKKNTKCAQIRLESYKDQWQTLSLRRII